MPEKVKKRTVKLVGCLTSFTNRKGKNRMSKANGFREKKKKAREGKKKGDGV